MNSCKRFQAFVKVKVHKTLIQISMKLEYLLLMDTNNKAQKLS